MRSHVPDTFKVPIAFWVGVQAIGLSPEAILNGSDLPATVVAGRAGHVTTAQFFALWRAIAELSPDPATGLSLVTRIDARQYPPAVIAAAHARDLRDALNRMARYKQLCAADEMRMTVARDECVIEFVWPHATEDEPPLLVDAAFAAVVELGRRGTDAAMQPKRLELKRRKEGTGAHAAYFGCPVKYNARRNALIMRASDLDRRFVSYNAELLRMMQRPLDKALAQRQARSSMCETVKWVLKRLLPGSSPDVFAVARELGVSGRTLQRRIADEGSSFRRLLLETRQELVRRYLTQRSIELNEVAYLLGYGDANSFYRAFRTWERTTPAHWRAQHRVSGRRNS